MEKANVIEELEVSFSYGQGNDGLYVTDDEDNGVSITRCEGEDIVYNDNCTFDFVKCVTRAFSEFKKLIEKHGIQDMLVEFDEGVGDIKISFKKGGVTSHISSIPESLLDAQHA